MCLTEAYPYQSTVWQRKTACPDRTLAWSTHRRWPMGQTFFYRVFGANSRYKMRCRPAKQAEY